MQLQQRHQLKIVVIVKNAIVLSNLIAVAFRKQDVNVPIGPALVEINVSVDAIANATTNLAIKYKTIS